MTCESAFPTGPQVLLMVPLGRTCNPDCGVDHSSRVLPGGLVHLLGLKAKSRGVCVHGSLFTCPTGWLEIVKQVKKSLTHTLKDHKDRSTQHRKEVRDLMSTRSLPTPSSRPALPLTHLQQVQVTAPQVLPWLPAPSQAQVWEIHGSSCNGWGRG